MTDKTAVQAFRELRETWLDLVSLMLPWFTKPIDRLNQFLRRARSLIRDVEEQA